MSDDIVVAVRGDEFSAFEEFQLLAVQVPGPSGRGEVKSQISVKPGDEFTFMGIVYRTRRKGYGHRRKFYDFIFTPMNDEDQISSEIRITVHDPFVILDHVHKV